MEFGTMVTRNKNAYRLYKRGDVWHAYISYVAESGERIQFRFSTRTTDRNTAERNVLKEIAQADKKSKILSGGLVEITLDEAFGRYMVEKGNYTSDPDTRMARLSKMKKEFGVKLLSEVNEIVINKFINLNRNKLSNTTINHYLSLLSVVVNTARDEWGAKTNKVKIWRFRLEQPDENIKFFKDWKTIEKIISKAPAHLKLVIFIGIYSGLRQGNILNLKWEQIDFVNKTFNLKVKSRRYAGGKNLIIPIADVLIKILKDTPRINDYVINYQGRPIKSIDSSWYNIFYNRVPVQHIITDKKGNKKTEFRWEFVRSKENLKDPNLPYMNFHTLRHTAATWILKKTKNLKITQQLLGHEDIRTTMKYAHVLDEEKRKALNQVFK